MLFVSDKKILSDWLKLSERFSTFDSWNDLVLNKNIDFMGCKIDYEGIYNQSNYQVKAHTCCETDIEKAALAMMKIYQVIDKCFGGVITTKEWNNKAIEKWVIGFTLDGTIEVLPDCKYYISDYTLLAFRTQNEAIRFLSNKENKQLVKDFIKISK